MTLVADAAILQWYDYSIPHIIPPFLTPSPPASFLQPLTITASPPCYVSFSLSNTLSFPSGSFNTPLHLAASKSQILAYSCLLYHGADQNATNERGETPMAIARKVGKPVAVSKAGKNWFLSTLDALALRDNAVSGWAVPPKCWVSMFSGLGSLHISGNRRRVF